MRLFYRFLRLEFQPREISGMNGRIHLRFLLCMEIENYWLKTDPTRWHSTFGWWVGFGAVGGGLEREENQNNSWSEIHSMGGCGLAPAQRKIYTHPVSGRYLKCAISSQAVSPCHIDLQLRAAKPFKKYIHKDIYLMWVRAASCKVECSAGKPFFVQSNLMMRELLSVFKAIFDFYLFGVDKPAKSTPISQLPALAARAKSKKLPHAARTFITFDTSH